MKRLTIFFFSLLATSITYSQNRVWELPTELGLPIFLDAGNGTTLYISDRSFGLDSTHVHVSLADEDFNFSVIGGFRLELNTINLNDAIIADNNILIAGSNQNGFNTRPFYLNMDSSGNVVNSRYFTNLGSQDQIHSLYAYNSDLDFFTTSR